VSTFSKSLRSRVTFKQQSTDGDALGQPLEVWNEVCKARANIKHLSGMETIKGDSPASIVKASIRVRYSYKNRVTAGMRAYNGATVYEIKALIPDEEGKRHLDITCEVVA
jgi:SPP1 family predicted phage head-tail adaptor